MFSNKMTWDIPNLWFYDYVSLSLIGDGFTFIFGIQEHGPEERLDQNEPLGSDTDSQ